MSVGEDFRAAGCSRALDGRGCHCAGDRRRGASGAASPLQLMRNGSRGLLWLEPLVEVEVAGRRYAYGPVQPAGCREPVRGGFASGSPATASLRTPSARGSTDEIPYLKRQERLTFARVGITDPMSLDDYLAHGGYRGLKAALAMPPAQIVETRDRLGPARPRRRGISGRHQMEDGARRPGRSEVRRVQRR